MKLIIDTNILLDVIGKREPFFDASKQVLALCESKKIQGFISSSTMTDLFYLIHKMTHSKETTYKALGNVLDIVKVLSVTNDDALSAFMQKATDFEDCLLATCAKSNGCDGIVTRNQKDFECFDIMTYTPEEIINLFRQRISKRQ